MRIDVQILLGPRLFATAETVRHCTEQFMYAMCREEMDSRKQRYKRQRKDLDERRFSKSASRPRRFSGKGHDWGNKQPKAKEMTAVPKAEEQKCTVSASEVPAALRAQIKAMLDR